MVPHTQESITPTDWYGKAFGEEVAREFGSGLVEQLVDAVPHLGERVEPRPEHVASDGTAYPCLS